MLCLKQFISIVLAIILCLSVVPNQVFAANEGSFGLLSTADLNATYYEETGQVTITSVPENAASLILAGYLDGQMVFLETEEDLAILPATFTLPTEKAYDSVKLFCLDANSVPLTAPEEVFSVNKSFAVTFVPNGENVENLPLTQYVFANDTIVEPVEPTKEGYMLLGWYFSPTETDWTKKINFETFKVTADLQLYAMWLNIEKDSDSDQLPDEFELYIGTDISEPDSDADDLNDWEEVVLFGYDPMSEDTDYDGIGDYYEDNDGDGISNGEELALGLNPLVIDSDADGLEDNLERTQYGTDPLKADTDEDGAYDGLEINYSTDPLSANSSFNDYDEAQELSEIVSVTANVSASVSGASLGTVNVTPIDVTTNSFFSKTIAGYLGCAYEFTAEEPVKNAKLTFLYDTSLGIVSNSFQPRIYLFDEDTQCLEELPNQTVSDGSVTVDVEHFSTYILLNKTEFDKEFLVDTTTIELMAGSTTDSNGDGILDCYDELIYNGQISLGNTAKTFMGINFGDLPADADGDGLLNGDELIISEVSIQGPGTTPRRYLYMASDPLKVDTDIDGFTDNNEILNGTDPLKFTYNAAAVNYLTDNDIYDSYNIAKQVNEKWDVKSYVCFFTSIGEITEGTTQEEIYRQQWYEYMLRYGGETLNNIAAMQERSALLEMIQYMSDDVYNQLEHSIRAGKTVAELSDLIDARKSILPELERQAALMSPAQWIAENGDYYESCMNTLQKYNINSAFQFSVWKDDFKNNITKSLNDAKQLKIEWADTTMTALSLLSKSLEIQQDYALLNANIEMFRSNIDLFDMMRSSDNDSLSSAADSIYRVLIDEAQDFTKLYREAILDTTDSTVRSLLIETGLDLVKTNPYVAAVTLVGELLVNHGIKRATQHNQIVANVNMTIASLNLLDKTLKNYSASDSKALADKYLIHLAQLRLVSEMRTVEYTNNFDYFEESLEHVEQRSNWLNLCLSETLLEDCRLLCPNITLRITDDLVSNSDPSPAKGAYLVRIDGQKLSAAQIVNDCYYFYLQPGNTYEIEVVSLGAYSYYQRQTVLVKKDYESELAFHFSYSGHLLTGKVLCGKDGQSVGNALLNIREGYDNKNGELYLSCNYPTTNASKVYWFKLPTGKYTAEILSSGYEVKYVNFTKNEGASTLNFELEPMDTYIFDGYVVDNNSNEIENVEVFLLQGTNVLGTDITNSDGYFSMTVNAVSSEVYYLTCAPVGYEPKTQKANPISGSAGSTANYLVLTKKVENELAVTHSELGDILALAAANETTGGIQLCNNVGASNWTVTGATSITKTGDWFDITQTDNGNGSTNLQISVKGYTLSRNSGAITFTKVDGSTQTVNIYQKAHTLSGTVVDTNGPVANAFVVIWNTDGFRSDSIITGADGTFSLPVYDASYSITVTTDAYGEKTIDVPAAVNMCDVDTGEIMVGADYNVTGVVLDENDQPISGVTVNWGQYRLGSEEPVTTDQQGRFRFNVTVYGSSTPVIHLNHNGYLDYVTMCTVLKDSITDIGSVQLTPVSSNSDLKIYAEGKCGENLYWQVIPSREAAIGSDDLELNITGTGTTWDRCNPMWQGIDDLLENAGLQGVEDLYISEGLTVIGERFFEGLYSVHEVSLPSTFETFSDDALFNNRLNWISVAEDNPTYTSLDGILYSKDMKTLIACPRRPHKTLYVWDDYDYEVTTELNAVIVPDSVTTIGSYAFTSCYIDTVILPDSVTEIEDWAFHGSTIWTIELPDSVIDIGSYAFASTNLIWVKLPEALTQVDSSCFYGCEFLEAIIIPENLNIGKFDTPFRGCESLKDVYFMGPAPSWVHSWTFEGCQGDLLLHFIEGKTGWTAPTWETKNGDSFNTTTFEPGEQTIFSGACNDTIMWELSDEGVLSIRGTGVMPDYDYFMSGYYEEGDDVPWARQRCIVKKVVVEEGITHIGDYAFHGCAVLEEAVLPGSITSIGDYAFQNCITLNAIELSSGLTSMGQFVFSGCLNLKAVELPDTLEALFEYVFMDCINLESVVLPDAIESIPMYAFRGCLSLKEVIIPDSVTVISRYAFDNCVNLQKVHMPANLESIEYSAFLGCSSLTEVIIPEHVISIGGQAFTGCNSLQKIYFYGDISANDVHHSLPYPETIDYIIYYQEGKGGWTSPTWSPYSGLSYNTATFIP